MRRWFRKQIWRVYRAEWKFFFDGEPSPKISLCKISRDSVGLIVLIVIFNVAFAVATIVGSLFGGIYTGIGWVLGFSPMWKKFIGFSWLGNGFADDLWHSKDDRGTVSSYYKVNKRFAPWEIILPPLPLTIWLLGFIIVPLGNALLYLLGGARKGRCPVPLDFSDVAADFQKETTD